MDRSPTCSRHSSIPSDRYRPRTEGLFARIERWTNIGDATDIFWRSISAGNVVTWYGLYGPKGMPPAVIAKLNKTLNEMLEEAPIRERLTKIGAVVKGSTPQAFAQFMAAEHKKWSEVRAKAGIEQK